MATSYADLLTRFGAATPNELPPVPAAKQAEVSAATEKKKAALGGTMPTAEELYGITAARAGGSGAAITNPIARDIRQNNVWQNFQKYGAASGDMSQQASLADANFRTDRNAARSTQEAIGDAAVGAAGGAISSVLGIGALGAGLVSSKAGGWLADRTQDFNGLVQSQQSAGLNARRRAYGAINASDMADSTLQYEQDIKDGQSSFVAGLSRIGRDAVKAVGNATDDSAILSDGVANGVGSLLVGGPLAKGLGAIGKAALKGSTYVAPSLLFSERAAKLATLGEKAAMPASIGLMEGGGTYQQTYEEAYAQLAGRKDLTEARKNEMANDAALEAAAIQTPLAAATGVLTSKFEASPFHVPTLKTAAGNFIKEGVEEGLQSGTSQLATNKGIQDQANARQTLSEGVGEQVGLGALYGAGTGGVLQAPGVALRSAVETAKLGGRTAMAGVKKIIGSVNDRADAVTETLTNQSPVAPAVMDQVYAAAVADAPRVQAVTVEAINAAKDATPQEKAATVDYVDNFFKQVQFTDTEADALPGRVGDIVRGSTDRFDAIKRAAAAAVDDTVDPETRLMAALYLEGESSKHSPDLVDTYNRMPDEHPAFDKMHDYMVTMSNLGSDPRVRDAIKVAQDFAKSFNADSVSDANIGTEQGQTAAQSVVVATSIDPTRVEPSVVDTVLKHAVAGKIQLTADQQAYLQAASDLNRVEQEYQDAGKKLGLTNSEIVTRQVRSDTGNPNSTGYSAAEHLSRVFAAMRVGKPDIARERMDELTNFAQSLQNKVAALNESFAGGKGEPVAYEAYNPNTKEFFKTTTPVFLNGRSENSVQTAQNIALDAKAVADVHSSLARSFPDLGFASIEQNTLAPEMMQMSADMASRAYKAKIQEANNQARRQKTTDRLASDPRAATSTQAPVDNASSLSQDRPKSKAPGDPVQAPVAVEKVEPQSKTEAPASLPREQQEVPAKQEAPAKSEASDKRVMNKLASVEDLTTQDEIENPAPSASSLKESETNPAPLSSTEAVDQKPVEADPVVQSEDATSVDENASTPVTGIDAAYPNLLGSPEGRGRNLFKQAFSLPVEAISRLTASENPIKTVKEALSSGANFRAFVGLDENTKLNEDTMAVYDKLMGFFPKMRKTLDARLAASFADPKNKKFISEGAWNAAPKFRAANIAEQNGESIAYNDGLIETSMLAAMQWFIQAEQRQRPLDDEDVGKILGFAPTDKQVRDFNQGLYYDGAVADLTDSIVRYWGVRSNADTGQGIVRGVPEGVAKEMLRAMEAAGLIQIKNFDVGVKTYRQIEFNITERNGKLDDGSFGVVNKPIFTSEERKALMRQPTLIETTAMVEPEELLYVGAPPQSTPKTQLRNPEVKLTAADTAMLKKEQSVPSKFVPHMYDFINAIDTAGAVELFAHGDLTNVKMNSIHRESLDSVNRQTHAAVEAIQAWGERANQVGQDQSKDFGEVEVFFPYEMTSVERAQAVGRHNPQASKLTREVLMPTRATVDLTNDLDSGRFWLSVAQAWGVKVHKQVRAASVADAQKAAAGQYSRAIKFLEDWLDKSTVNQAMSPEEARELKRLFNPEGAVKLKPVAPVAFYAAMEVARFNKASELEKKTFTTSLYVEADGITDGPMNAMHHTVAGDFTTNWLGIVRKGGTYINDGTTTSNEQADQVDLYQVGSEATKTAIRDKRQSIQNNIPVRDSMDAMLRLMTQHMGGDIMFDPSTGELTIKRGAMKNPLTVKIYGAGDMGIANKIASTLVKAIYETMTDRLQFADANPKATPGEAAQAMFPGLDPEAALAKLDQYERDINRMMHSIVQFDRAQTGGLGWADLRKQTKRNTASNPEDFEFSSEQLKNLDENVRHLLVTPMKEGISATIGETEQGTTLLRKATQVMSIYLKYAEQRAVQRALDAREKLAETDGTGWKRSDFLSQRELRAVKDSLRHLVPFVETGTQTLMISGSSRVPLMANSKSKTPLDFSRALDGEDYTSGYMQGSQNSGVSGIPKVTIGTGDGQMMQSFSTDPEVNDGYLLIFDGANFRLTDLETYSQLMNKAVHTGWMMNPMAAVAKSMTDFMNVADLSVHNDAMSLELNTALTKKRETAPDAFIKDHIQEVAKGLTELSNDIQARKNVLARLQMSVDHMASAEAPYQSSETLESLVGLSDEQAVARMNEMLNEERSKLAQEERKTAAPVVDTLTVTETPQLANLVAATSLKGEDRKLFAEVVRNAQDLGYKIVSGSREQVAAYIGENNLTKVSVAPGEKVKGVTVTGDRTIYMIDPSEETLMHEMIHAATIGQVQSYYLQDGKLSAEKTEAVARIEALMQEWLANTDAFEDLNFETNQAAENARVAITQQLQGKSSPALNKAGALNEFMAWVLSNQKLSQVASQTKVTNPIARIVKDVLAALKSLLGIRTKVSDDLLSNLRFNTQVLMAGTPSMASALSNTIHYQSGNFGRNDRLTQIGEQFTTKVVQQMEGLEEPGLIQMQRDRTAQDAALAASVMGDVTANGFPMDMQAGSTFQMMLAAFTADIQLDPNALGRAQELFTHVAQNLKVEDFMVDPAGQDQADRYQAQAKYDTIVGARTVAVDEEGRSTLVPTFLALATVDEGFRSVLSKMDLPKSEKLTGNSVDEVVTNYGTAAMDRLSLAMAGEKKNSPSVQASLDSLVDRISDITQDRTAFIDQMAAPTGNAIDAMNAWMVKTMSAMAKEVNRRADQLKAKTTSRTLTTGADFAKLLAGVVDKDVAGMLSQSVMTNINKSGVWQPVADLMNELVGRTSENAGVYDMIKQVRSVIQSLRQQYREHLPELIQKQFSRELTDAEQSSLYKGLAKTDLASLRSSYSVKEILELAIDPVKRATETKKLEKGLSNVTLLKSRQLAEFMNTGRPGTNLLRNAYAIAKLLGTGARTDEPTPVVLNNIDHLVSLYALGGLNQTDRDSLASLVQTEAEGMNFALSYLEGQRNDELSNATVGPNDEPSVVASKLKIQANLYKGYMPSEQQGGVSLIVANDADFVELNKRGYKRVSDYEGSDAEYGKIRKGYYFSPISGKAVYSQGIVQTVHTSVSGINAATGFSNSMTAGRITDPKAVERISKVIDRRTGGKEQLLPVFDENGKVVAYERSIDPLEMQRLNSSTHFGNMLGAWRGRQAEEALAGKYNEALIDRLHEMWNTPDQLERKDEFVNLFDKRELAKDPVLADSVKLIPFDTLEYVRQKFGNGQFMVRRDMLNDALGYRQPSVGDAWTGTTRWSPEVQKNIQQIATSVFGADAYKRMIQAEKFIQNRVTDARVMIVVKSIVVPLTNLIANVYQLSANGVPLATTLRSMPKKTAEVDGYVKGRLRKIELEGLLRASSSNVVAQNKYRNEIQSIEDTWKRLSIWPLIQAGEFTSVSDVGLGKEDIDITEGRLSAYIENMVDKMPDGIKTAAKYAIVSKDTALFKGLQKTVEYGDFLAKAILYDDLIGRQKKTREQALGEVTEEFVNYDRLPGRTRSYLENMGLIWFWNFKVRSAKIAVKMIRNNPLHAMLSMMAPTPPLIGSVGNPITDNIFAVAADGRLGNSIGPGQGLRSMGLNPWINLAG